MTVDLSIKMKPGFVPKHPTYMCSQPVPGEWTYRGPESNPSDGEASRPDGTALEIFEQHRPLLFAIAYRMMGTLAEAEDALQEAFIRWQAAATGGISSPKAFLITVVSRLCLNNLQSARAQREQYVGQWLPEPVITSGAPDVLSRLTTQDSISMAFLLLLERLTPVERAVFVLREVFDLEYEQIASIVGKSEANCRQILRRARKYVAEKRPRFEASAQEREKLSREFLKATTSGDLEQLVALLAENVAFYSDGGGKAAAVPNVVVGVNKVARLLIGALKKLVPVDVDRHIVEANGQPGIASYLHGTPHSMLCLDIYRGRIQSIYVVANPDKLRSLHIGLPEEANN